MIPHLEFPFKKISALEPLFSPRFISSTPPIYFDELYGVFIPSHGIILSRLLPYKNLSATDDDLIRENKMENKSQYRDVAPFHSTCDFLFFAGGNGVDNIPNRKKGMK